MDTLGPAAEAMAKLLGWSEAETQKQIAECRTIRAKEMNAVHQNVGRV
jgi:hypothetical protein